MTAPTLDVSHHYFDVAYTGVPKQCSAKDTTCKQLQHEMRFDKWLSADEENKFKYVLDVDANYASGKFKRLMCVCSPFLSGPATVHASQCSLTS